ncbi:MAG TPA: autotransporter-associated beta strand repeat-containing protein, partial [Thermoguttaceae bacterium]
GNWTSGPPISNSNTCLYFQSTGDFDPNPNNNIPSPPFILRKITFQSFAPDAHLVGSGLSFANTSLSQGIYNTSGSLATIDNPITWNGTNPLNLSSTGGLLLTGGITATASGTIIASGNDITLSTGTFNTGSSGKLYVGNSGPATMSIDDGATANIGELYVNYQSSRTGDTSTLTLVDGVITVSGATYIGRGNMPGGSDDYSAKLIQNGGTINFNGLTKVGSNGTAKSLYEVSNGTGSATAGLVVGDLGNGILSIHGAGAVSVSGGSGFVIGQDANRATSGAVELISGALSVNGNVTLGNGGIGTLTRIGGDMTVTGNLVAGGAGVLVIDATVGPVPSTFNGTLQRIGTGPQAGTLVVVPFTGNLSSSESISFNSAVPLTNGIIGPFVVRQASGTESNGDYLKTTGSGPYTLATADYTSTNYGSSGPTSVVTVTNDTTLTADTSAYAVRSGPKTTTINTKLTVGSGGVILNGATMGGSGQLDLGTTALIYAGSDNTSTISASLKATSGMVKFGPSSLILSNNNTQLAGNTYVNSGTLIARNSGSLGTTGSGNGTIVSTEASFEIQNNISIGNEYLTLNGSGFNGGGALRSTNTNSFGGPITLASPSLINVLDGILSLTNAISGNAFTKSGTGTLVLSGNNSAFASAINVAQGTLTASHQNALGTYTSSSGTTVEDGATLAIQGNINIPAEPLTIGSTGYNETGSLRNISGVNSFAGDIALTADTQISIDAGSLTLSSAVFTSNDFSLTKTGTGTLVVEAGFESAGDLTVLGGTAEFSHIVCNSLTIGAGSRVVLTPIAGGPLGGSFRPLAGNNITSVPEPSILTLLYVGLAALCFYIWRSKCRLFS